MSEEQFEVQIATVLGKYPGESGSDTLTFKYDDDPSNKLKDYACNLIENSPSTLRLKLWNPDGGLIGATYNAAKGEGSLQGGLEVIAYLYPQEVKTLEFHGKLKAPIQVGNFLEIECSSDLAELEDILIDTYWASSYREQYERFLQSGGNLDHIDGIDSQKGWFQR